MSQAKLWVSAFIVAVVALHALPVISYQGVRQTRWPFLVYAMYARSYPAGPIETSKRTLVASTASGRDEEVTPKLAGLSKPTFRNMYINPVYGGDSTVARELLDRISRGRPEPFVELRTQGLKYSVTDRGLVTEQYPVLTFRAPSGETR